MKKNFNYGINQPYIGYWVGSGRIECENKDEARQILLDESFEADDWDDSYSKDYMSVYQFNGDKLFNCLDKITTMTDDLSILNLIKDCLNNLEPVIEIQELYEHKY